jgi:predicted enzyme related to lactoylglutathione lyase
VVVFKRLGPTAVVVKDYDEAVEYYTQKLGFELKEDKLIDKKIRVVVVAQQSDNEATITLLKADSCDKLGKFGAYVRSNTLRILETEDIRQAYAIMKAKGVKFIGEPIEVPYGMEVSFEDLYGNEFDLIEVKY